MKKSEAAKKLGEQLVANLRHYFYPPVASSSTYNVIAFDLLTFCVNELGMLPPFVLKTGNIQDHNWEAEGRSESEAIGEPE